MPAGPCTAPGMTSYLNVTGVIIDYILQGCTSLHRRQKCQMNKQFINAEQSLIKTL